MASAVLALIVENKRRLHIRPRCCTKHTYVVTRMKLSCASHQLSHWRVATLHAFWGSLQLAEAATKQLRATAQCTASRWLKPAENKFTHSGLTSFSMQVLQIQIVSVSGYVKHYIFKICQIVAGISMIRQFHEFFESHFWRVFDVWRNCVPPPPSFVWL